MRVDVGRRATRLTTHARVTAKGRGLEHARILLGDGLLTSEGEEHRRHRRALQPAFHPEHMAAYLAFMLAAANRSMSTWRDGREIDLTRQMSALTLDAVASALFGDDLRERADDVQAAMETFLGDFRVVMLPFGRRLLEQYPPRRRRLEAAWASLDGVVEAIVAGLRTARSEGRDAAGLTTERGTVTRQLLSGPVPLSDTQIRDHVLTLLLAGHETTAMGLTWAYVLLADDPDLLTALQREWDGAPTALDPLTLPATLPLTTAVVAETFRLRPPAWLIGRRATAPFRLGGLDITPGTLVIVTPAGLHRDARWWPEPDSFDPGRWLATGPAGAVHFTPRLSGQPRGAYFPFGAGPRQCIGEQFAWIEATALLAELGRRWTVDVHRPLPAPGPASITLRPGGVVRATLHAR